MYGSIYVQYVFTGRFPTFSVEDCTPPQDQTDHTPKDVEIQEARIIVVAMQK